MPKRCSVYVALEAFDVTHNKIKIHILTQTCISFWISCLDLRSDVVFLPRSGAGRAYAGFPALSHFVSLTASDWEKTHNHTDSDVKAQGPDLWCASQKLTTAAAVLVVFLGFLWYLSRQYSEEWAGNKCQEHVRCHCVTTVMVQEGGDFITLNITCIVFTRYSAWELWFLSDAFLFF